MNNLKEESKQKDEERNITGAISIISQNPSTFLPPNTESLTVEQFEELLAKCNSMGGDVIHRDGTVTMFFNNGNTKPHGRGGDMIKLSRLADRTYKVVENKELFKS